MTYIIRADWRPHHYNVIDERGRIVARLRGRVRGATWGRTRDATWTKD